VLKKNRQNKNFFWPKNEELKKSLFSLEKEKNKWKKKS